MPLQFISSLLIILTPLFLEAAEEIICFPCRGEECNIEPEGCLYGVSRDPCGRIICSAGPGERCGGRDGYFGKCGDGMTCKCGKCRGCSIVRLYSGFIDCDYNDPICT